MPALTNAQDWLDGNGIGGLVDPANAPQSFIFRDEVDNSSVTGDVTPDNSAYAGGNKEDDTRNWGYINNSGPNDKTDYRHVMAGVKVSGGNPYVFLGAERIDTNGSMVVDFELNQKPFKVFPGAPGVAKPDRSVNDLLISLEYANGGTNPEVTLYRVSAVQAFNTGQVVTFSKISDATTLSAVRSATNFAGAGERRLPVGDLHRAGLRVGRGLGQHRCPRPAGDLPQLRAGLHPQPDRRRPRRLAAQGRQPALPAVGQHLRLADDPTRSTPSPTTWSRARPSRSSRIRGSAPTRRR